ncbi:MAG: hypothetical protein Satyrvirus30_4 [Satyrvirus sp.]|uniref:DUF1308 domain-containing protein n=1 Tax=Satyrvirus sp. TaxID=2487771 RepID=A0A3G5AJH3_9VIRU|nr:MAG: hypothetical protein Satyrvirus30_4 [Satyrvirus sp.]
MICWKLENSYKKLKNKLFNGLFNLHKPTILKRNSMAMILNWKTLLDAISDTISKNDSKNNIRAFQKLLDKVNAFVNRNAKSKSFDILTVHRNHKDMFNVYVMVYEQLLIEDDVIDVLTYIYPLDDQSNENIGVMFHLICVGKWIKIHEGTSSKIFFHDDEKTVISNKTLANNIKKINIVRSKYEYFGEKPLVCYKFKKYPSADVVEYLKMFNVISLDYNQKSPPTNFREIDKNIILVNINILTTLCSNLSYEFDETCYKIPSGHGNKDELIKNKKELDEYIKDKTMLISSDTYENFKTKIKHIAGSTEKSRFEKLLPQIKIVPDAYNPRFGNLPKNWTLFVSVAEKECATMVITNENLKKELDTYFPEFRYKVFMYAQLVEKVYWKNI